MSESSAHTSPGDAEMSTVPLAVIGACWSMSISGSSP